MQILKRFLAVIVVIAVAGCPVSSEPTVNPSSPPEDSESLDQLVERTLRENLSGRSLTTDTHGAWQILHGVLTYGDQFAI